MTSTAGGVFWAWVAQNQERMRSAIESSRRGGEEDPVMDELLAQLHQVDPALFFVMGALPGGGTAELIITAEGNIAAFPAVAALVKEAAPLKGWEVTAFKPAQGCDFVIKYEGARVEAKQLWFLPLSSQSGGFGVRIGCATYEPQLDEAFRFAVIQVLDVVLGEVVAARDLHHVEVLALPDAHLDEGYLPMTELAEYVSALNVSSRN